ncbi:MobA/MobL family protein, partial [Psychrobacter namhaensis]
MAIFLASTKSISRGKGQSAVASASYRAGVKLDDLRYGKTHDYSKRSGVMSADIILPSVLASANTDISRSDLWNKAEAAEKRKDARVAREWLVNLPHELSAEDRKAIAHQFAQTLADRYGTIADCAIHKPTQREIERGADPRNFHAHIMFTTRTAKLGDNNEILLTDKATIELSDNKRRSLGLERVNDEIKEVRQIWEQIVNEKLAKHNHKLIDSRSYADQGKDIKPQIKMGAVATEEERKAYAQAKAAVESNGMFFHGISPVTIKGKHNKSIAERNQLVAKIEIAKNYKPNAPIIFKRDHNERNRQTIEWTEQAVEHLSNRDTDTARAINDISERVDKTKRLIAERSEAIKHSAAPISYDTDYERAFFERKRQADRA